MGGDLTLTLILVIMTSIISYQAFSNPEMKAKMLFRPVSIEQGDWYRFFSSGLIHADFIHLLVNMYVLYVFGTSVESFFTAVLFGPVMGKLAYLVFYFSAIAIASYPSYIRHQGNYAYSALGASGATSAIVFAFILINPWAGLTFVFFPFFSIPAIIMGIGYLWYSSYMDKKGMDNIGHNAHFSGAVYGIFFTILSVFIFNYDYVKVMFTNLISVPALGSY